MSLLEEGFNATMEVNQRLLLEIQLASDPRRIELSPSIGHKADWPQKKQMNLLGICTGQQRVLLI